MTNQKVALTFDADQTLWDFKAVMNKALRDISAAMSTQDELPPEAVSVERLSAARERVVRRSRGQPHSLEAVRLASFEIVLAEAGHQASAARAAVLTDRYMNIRFNEIELYPEVRSVLAWLGKHFKLGLISNGNTDPTRSGLPDTFDSVVLGPEHGIEKPDPRAFRLAAEQLGVAPSQLIHVGDGWDDVEGANNVGATSILIHRSGPPPSFAPDADHVVGDLSELGQLLALDAPLGRRPGRRLWLGRDAQTPEPGGFGGF